MNLPYINNINSHTDVTSFIPLFILFMLFEFLFEFPPLWRWLPSLMKVWWHFTWIILLFCLYSACIRDERTFYWKSHNMKSSELSITKIWFFDLIKSGFMLLHPFYYLCVWFFVTVYLFHSFPVCLCVYRCHKTQMILNVHNFICAHREYIKLIVERLAMATPRISVVESCWEWSFWFSYVNCVFLLFLVGSLISMLWKEEGARKEVIKFLFCWKMTFLYFTWKEDRDLWRKRWNFLNHAWNGGKSSSRERIKTHFPGY